MTTSRFELRDYQRQAIDDLFQWFEDGNKGNPCLVLPTGAGKSVVIAAMVRQIITTWPDQVVLMLTHQKELIEQNAAKMRSIWPDAPLGIYSASIGQRNIDKITYAGIQSVRNKADIIGHVDIIIIDECHLVNTAESGSYRKLIARLSSINPYLRVIGLTATPYRLSHGMITDGKQAIFDAIIDPVTVGALISKGHLSRLRSKLTEAKIDVSGVGKRGGEFIESQLAAAADNSDLNAKIAAQICDLGSERKSWILFCSGVAHAEHMCAALRARGIIAECVTGETPAAKRADILSAFQSGNIRALTNANVLTTGFDAPSVDLIAMLRPTASPGLYVQMAGRGLRIAPGKTDCLVLDFAGNVERHGPIVDVIPPERGKKGEGPPPVKPCPSCNELVPIAASTCPDCGHVFPPPKIKPPVLRNDDIMGESGTVMTPRSWIWRSHQSKTSGKLMLSVSYNFGPFNAPIVEYLPIMHDGYAGDRARKDVMKMFTLAGSNIDDSIFDTDNPVDIAKIINSTVPAPSIIEVKRDGNYHRVTNRMWA